MINIHLANDQKFINQSRDRFERIFPGLNIFVIDNEYSKAKFVIPHENTLFMEVQQLSTYHYLKNICDKHSEINVFIHLLNSKKAALVSQLKLHYSLSTYWIFYGTDLYQLLEKRGIYKLYDRDNIHFQGWNLLKVKKMIRHTIIKDQNGKNIQDFIKNLDFFCFWNYYDHNLLLKNFTTRAIFKPFIYESFNIHNSKLVNKNSLRPIVLVNHSGSETGNHKTILKKILKLGAGKRIKKIIVPLSYGNLNTINDVNDFGINNFESIYEPISDFLPKKDYFNLLGEVDVAFFGHRRQEAGGNILFLLASGVKVFLRKSNNLFTFFKDLGVNIYNLEEDFSDFSDLVPLNKNLQINNRRIILSEFSEEKIDYMYKNLLN